MNRHERRRVKAIDGVGPGDISPGYVKMVETLGDVVVAWLAAGNPVPQFAFPPKDYLFAGDLGHFGPRFARSDSARGLVKRILQVTNEGTVFGLDAALELVGVPVERVSLKELGIEIPSA